MTRQRPKWKPPPRRRRAPFAKWPPWEPEGVARAKLGELRYIVVEEIVKPTCVLAVSTWPRVDDEGHVRFPLDERPHLVRVELGDLSRYLKKHRAGRNRGREVRIGDVFAAAADTDALPEPESEAEAHATTEPRDLDWLGTPVYDITAPARETAKIALYSAVAPVLTPEEAEKLGKEK